MFPEDQTVAAPLNGAAGDRIKHATASVFIFACDDRGRWRTGLVRHPLFENWIMPGGHVEAEENPAEAALREAEEETALRGLRLLPPPSAPWPGTGADDVTVAPPWWIVEHLIPNGDNHLKQPHVHVDSKYAAVAPDPEPAGDPETRFAWFSPAELDGLEMFPDVRLCSKALFEVLDQTPPS